MNRVAPTLLRIAKGGSFFKRSTRDRQWMRAAYWSARL